MRRQQINNCIFSNWYKNFKSVTFKSEVIPLSQEFVDYLTSDGIVLPDAEKSKYSNDLQSYSDSDDDDGWDDENSDTPPMFPQLKLQVLHGTKSQDRYPLYI